MGFDLGNQSKVGRLMRLRDGDLIEVEQWGGPLYSSPECPPICGMWGVGANGIHKYYADQEKKTIAQFQMVFYHNNSSEGSDSHGGSKKTNQVAGKQLRRRLLQKSGATS